MEIIENHEQKTIYEGDLLSLLIQEEDEVGETGLDTNQCVTKSSQS